MSIPTKWRSIIPTDYHSKKQNPLHHRNITHTLTTRIKIKSSLISHLDPKNSPTLLQNAVQRRAPQLPRILILALMRIEQRIMPAKIANKFLKNSQIEAQTFRRPPWSAAVDRDDYCGCRGISERGKAAAPESAASR